LTDIISHSKAAEIAAQWGSYIWAGDPGAIFYSFPGDGPPDWSDEAKQAAIEHCKSCITIAEERIAEFWENASACPTDYTEDPEALQQDLEDLQDLLTYIESYVPFYRGFITQIDLSGWDISKIENLAWLAGNAECKGD